MLAAVLAALGAYRITGASAVTLAFLVPLAELNLVGLVEEMVFRGVVFGVTERALGSKIAIVLSALVFAAAHLPNDGDPVLTGGAFGIEGSLVTVVLIGAVAVVLLRRAFPSTSR